MVANNYYDETYQDLRTRSEKACNRIDSSPCSRVSDVMQSIKSEVSNLHLNIDSAWPDDLGSSFSNAIGSCSDALDALISSISSTWSGAETTYRLQLENLEKLEAKNTEYQETVEKEPKNDDPKYYKWVVDHNLENGVPVNKKEFNQGLYNQEHAAWQRQVQNLEGECKALQASIDASVSKLSGISFASVGFSKFSGVGAGGESTGLLNSTLSTLELKANEYLKTDIESYLAMISNDPSKCVVVRDLRGYSNTSVHTVMGWQTVTREGTNQTRFRSAVYPDYTKESTAYYDEDGLAKVGDRYVVATTRYYGDVGDYIDIVQEDGTIIPAIIGDLKNTSDKGCTPIGHENGTCVVEFVVDCHQYYKPSWTQGWGHFVWNGKKVTDSDVHPEWNQNVAEVRNLGNYDDYADEFGYEKAGINHGKFLEL